MEEPTQKTEIIQLQEIVLELDAVNPGGGQITAPGSLCPKCGRGILDYNGLLVLRCPACDFAEGGCFT